MCFRLEVISYGLGCQDDYEYIDMFRMGFAGCFKISYNLFAVVKMQSHVMAKLKLAADNYAILRDMFGPVSTNRKQLTFRIAQGNQAHTSDITVLLKLVIKIMISMEHVANENDTKQPFTIIHYIKCWTFVTEEKIIQENRLKFNYIGRLYDSQP